jgi:hypothetical protein
LRISDPARVPLLPQRRRAGAAFLNIGAGAGVPYAPFPELEKMTQ